MATAVLVGEWMKRAIWVSVIAAIAMTACQGRRFEPSHSISKFRVMGIQAEPPEVRPNSTTTLDALVYAPNGDVSYRWEWCPFQTSGSDFYACPITQEEIEEQIAESLPDDLPPGLFTFPDFDLGTDPTATLPYPFAQPILVAFCEAIADAAAQAEEENEQFAGLLPQVNCDERYEVSVRLVANNGPEPLTDAQLENLSEQDQSEVIVAAKRVSLWLGSEQEQDLNPIVNQLEIRPASEGDLDTLREAGHDWVDEIDDFEDDWYPIPPDETVPILVGVAYELHAAVEPSSVQTYGKLTPDGAQTDERYQDAEKEVLVYNWFTTAGGLEDSESLYVDGRNSLNDAGVTTLYIPTTDTSQQFNGSDGAAFIASCPEVEDDDDLETGCEVQIWSVVRDDRRGQGWLQGTLKATGISPDTNDEDPFGLGGE